MAEPAISLTISPIWTRRCLAIRAGTGLFHSCNGLGFLLAFGAMQANLVTHDL